jgi:hypothetical protein
MVMIGAGRFVTRSAAEARAAGVPAEFPESMDSA